MSENLLHFSIVLAVLIAGEGFFEEVPVEEVAGFQVINSGDLFPWKPFPGTLLQKFLEKMVKPEHLVNVVEVVDEIVLPGHA